MSIFLREKSAGFVGAVCMSFVPVIHTAYTLLPDTSIWGPNEPPLLLLKFFMLPKELHCRLPLRTYQAAHQRCQSKLYAQHLLMMTFGMIPESLNVFVLPKLAPLLVLALNSIRPSLSFQTHKHCLKLYQVG